MTDRDTLPTEFFDNLTSKQAATLDILLDAKGAADDPDDEWVRGVDLRSRMRDRYELEVAPHPGGTSGSLSGLTRRYSRSFRTDLIEGEWIDENHVRFRVGDRYEQALRAQRHRLSV